MLPASHRATQSFLAACLRAAQHHQRCFVLHLTYSPHHSSCPAPELPPDHSQSTQRRCSLTSSASSSFSAHHQLQLLNSAPVSWHQFHLPTTVVQSRSIMEEPAATPQLQTTPVRHAAGLHYCSYPNSSASCISVAGRRAGAAECACNRHAWAGSARVALQRVLVLVAVRAWLPLRGVTRRQGRCRSPNSSASCVRRAGGRAGAGRISCHVLSAASAVCHSSQMGPVHAGVVTLGACRVLHVVLPVRCTTQSVRVRWHQHGISSQEPHECDAAVVWKRNVPLT